MIICCSLSHCLDKVEGIRVRAFTNTVGWNCTTLILLRFNYHAPTIINSTW